MRPHDGALAEEVEALIGARASTWGFAKGWRDKTLAHRDLDTALGRRAEPLEGIGRAEVEGALESLRAVLNLIHERRLGGSVLFEGLHRIGDADALIALLRIGSLAAKERRARFLAGRPLPSDFER